MEMEIIDSDLHNDSHSFNCLPNDKILDLSKLKEFADNKIKAIYKQNFFYGMDWKTLWEKEKMLVTSIFSFSHSVFKRLLIC